MNKNVVIATGIGVAAIIGIIAFQVNETTWKQVSVDEYYEKDGKVPGVVYPENPQILGPLQVNKDKYLLGENVYVIITNLRPQDKGIVDFITPGGVLYETMGFDGKVSDYKKKYFKPQLLNSKDLCEKEKLIGQWTVMFRGYEMSKLYFEIVPEILPNQEHQFIDCSIAYEIDIKKP
tara:strand:+ start:687 stop:1217 length:531 start_codon:yes stop_codon:yes gene_type:complete